MERIDNNLLTEEEFQDILEGELHGDDISGMVLAGEFTPDTDIDFNLEGGEL